MAVSVSITYPEPQPQPQPVGAAMGSVVSINLSTNEVILSIKETLQAPDGSKSSAASSKQVKVLLSDSQLGTFLQLVVTEARAQGVLAAGSTMKTVVG